MFPNESERQDILSQKLYLTKRTDELQREIFENCFCLGGDAEEIRRSTTAEILAFLAEVKADRLRQRNESGLTIALIYYLWHDGQAGQLRFNFINANHTRLPFGCELQLVEQETEIIDCFRNSEYRNGIPLDEFTDDDSGDEPETEAPLVVYRETIN